MFAVLRFLVSIWALLGTSGETKSPQAEAEELASKEIVLQQRSDVIVTAYSGNADCKVGMIYLQSPAAKTVPPYKLPEAKSHLIGSTVIFDHLPRSRENTILGTYDPGQKLVFAFQFKDKICNSSFPSTSARVKIYKIADGHYEYHIDDAKDKPRDADFDDLYLEVIIRERPGTQVISDAITAVSPFNNPPHYRYPTCDGSIPKVQAGPNSGHHGNIAAYDLAMKKGENICASEKGRVLWIEDSFGPGCKCPHLRSSVNLIIIQTEEGVNQNYLHLQQGSVPDELYVGAIVQQGQLIGRVGNSGYVDPITGDGSHLHIEWVRNCYGVEKRPNHPVGTGTLKWSCPAFPATAPFRFN